MLWRKYRRILTLLAGLILIGLFCSSNNVLVKSYDSRYLLSSADSQDLAIKYISYETTLQNYRSILIEKADIDWSDKAYVFYATSPERLLPVLINVHQLQIMGSKAQVELIYTYNHPFNSYENRQKAWLQTSQAEPAPDDPILDILESKFNVHINYLPSLQNIKSKPGEYWGDSFTKLHAWHLTQYKKVIYLDADGLIRKPLDSLFFLPSAELATTIEYHHVPVYNEKWFGSYLSVNDILPTPLEIILRNKDIYDIIEKETEYDATFFKKMYNFLPEVNPSIDAGSFFNNKWQMKLASYIMVIEPSEKTWDHIKEAVKSLKSTDWDMELINKIWNPKGLADLGNSYNGKPSLLLIPHSPYAILSGEFRKSLHQHVGYLTTPVDFGYLGDPAFEKVSLRDLQRAGVTWDSLEDVEGVGVWDWAWRFDQEGRLTTGDIDTVVDNIEGMVAKRSINEKKKYRKQKSKGPANIIPVYKSIEAENIFLGMGVDRIGWDPNLIRRDIIYVHWSDYPLVKPWQIIEDLGNLNWAALKKWSNEMDMNAQSSSLTNDGEIMPLLDELIKMSIQSFKECKNSRGSEDVFGISVCRESAKEWKKLYLEYWEVMNDNLQNFK